MSGPTPGGADLAPDFEVRVEARHVDMALRRFLWRRLGWSGVLVTLFAAVYVGWDVAQGGPGPLSSVLGSVVVLLYALLFMARGVRRKQARQLLEQLGDEPVRYTCGEDALRVHSRLGGSSVRWEAFRELDEGPDVCLLFVDPTQYLTLPTDQIPPEALEKLREHLRAAGAQVG